MSQDLLTSSLAGAIFGAALSASGVFSPAVIISQMQFTNMHMLKVFMTASASSALIMYFFDRFGITKTKPRTASSLGRLGPYDGNIIGGLCIGFGMTLTGACPGTVLVQTVAGVSSGAWVMLGGVLAGIFYSRYSSMLKSSASAVEQQVDTNLTVQGKLNIDTRTAVLAYEVMCVACIALATSWGPRSSSALHPVVGGSLIGTAQAATLMLTGAPVGVSGAYGVIGDSFWRVSSMIPGGDNKSWPRMNSLYFATGLLAGSSVFFRTVPSAAHESAMDISALRATLGGFIMVLGARIAGGCTSGHGISGMSMLSISSFISVAAMFAGGMGLALFI